MKISEVFSKYFALDEEEYEKLVQEFKSQYPSDVVQNFHVRRLINILNAVLPYCEKFQDTDVKIKHKVAEMLLTKLNYNNFDETLDDTYDRLYNLFKETTARNINPYKIIYSGVLTDGNLKSDYTRTNKKYSRTRDFVNIYDELCRILDISETQSEQETRPSKIFEKCTTLISKVSSDRIPEIFNYLCNLSAWRMHIFREKDEHEVTSILKNNPSLFAISTDKIGSAFNYLRVKMQPLLSQNPPKFTSKPEDNQKFYEIWLLRNWIKNNSSLLTISADVMHAKENFLTLSLAKFQDSIDNQVMQKLFQDPVSLSILNQIPIQKMRENSSSNIQALQDFVKNNFEPKEWKFLVSNYIVSNPYFLAMPKAKVSNLLSRIQDASEYNKDLAARFLFAGRTLFASNIDFYILDIFNKLMQTNSMIEIDVDSLNERDLLLKFNEIFFNSPKFMPTLDKLISERTQRDRSHEKELRKMIRTVGYRMQDLRKFLTDSKKSISWNMDCLKSVVDSIDKINKQRFEIESSAYIHNVETNEYDHARNIEYVFNRIRDIYEQKRFKVGKKYINSDKLYEKMMDYLGKVFDDKEPIEKIYHEEITKPFVELLVTDYQAKESPQIGILERKLEVPKITPKELQTTLEKIGKAISKGDSRITFEFEKQKSFDKK